jgi:HAE1 family hydrophobic/amphiphilic exporter-1
VAVFVGVLVALGVSVTVGVAVLISGAVSLSITHMLCSQLLSPSHHRGRLYNFSERIFDINRPKRA